VTRLAMENLNMEFFIEGTRSRTNKIMAPKYGFLSILTKAYYKKKVEDLTFIPVTINYTRTLEGETFPIELTG
jgi:glycerol-3-phosphate O-acyltransferase